MVKRLLFGALLCAFVHCFSSYKCLHHGGLTLHRLHAVQDLPNGVSKDEDDWFYDTEDLEIIEENLLRLKEEVKKKKVILDAAELAVRRTRELLLKRKPTFGSCDYGYSVFEHNTTNEETVPRSAIRLGTSNFIREGQNLIRRRSGNDKVDPAIQKNRDLIKQLTLSNDAIWKREDARPRVKAPWVIRIPYLVLCNLLDVFFEGDPMSRFFFLETVARMPYFSYITMLHTYETLGWWRRSAETKRVHFAEEMNEYHHLLIMESLGMSSFLFFLSLEASFFLFFGVVIL